MANRSREIGITQTDAGFSMKTTTSVVRNAETLEELREQVRTERGNTFLLGLVEVGFGVPVIAAATNYVLENLPRYFNDPIGEGLKLGIALGMIGVGSSLIQGGYNNIEGASVLGDQERHIKEAVESTNNSVSNNN